MNFFISVLVLCAFSKSVLGMDDALEVLSAPLQAASASSKKALGSFDKVSRSRTEDCGPQEQMVLSWNKGPYYKRKVQEAFESIRRKGRSAEDFATVLQTYDIQSILRIFPKSAYGNIVLALSEFYGEGQDITDFCKQLAEDVNLPTLLALTQQESSPKRNRSRGKLTLEMIKAEEKREKDAQLDALINKCEQKLYASYVFQALKEVYKKGMLMQGMTVLLSGNAVQEMIHHAKSEDHKDVILSLVDVYGISSNMEAFADRVMKSEDAKDLIYNHHGSELKDGIVAMSELNEDIFGDVMDGALRLIYKFQEGVSVAGRAVRTVAKVFDIHEGLIGVAFGDLDKEMPLEDDEYYGEEDMERVFAIFEKFYNSPDAA